MNEQIKHFILRILEQGKDLAITTVRPDGYPQATTVNYANDELIIYIDIRKDSQKTKKSMGAEAEIIKNNEAINRASACIIKRFPEAARWAKDKDLSNIAFLQIKPSVISVLAYEKGFSHTALVSV